MEETKKGLTFSLLFTLVSVTIGSSFVFGYNVGVMNAPAQLIKTWIQNESYPSVHLTSLDDHMLIEIWSWIVSVFILSGAVGGLLCGYAADKLGRKKAMMINDLFAITGAVIMGLSKMTNAYYLLLIGRVVLGVSCGTSSGLGPMYLTELAPLRLRGVLGNVNGFVIILGFFTSQALGLPELLGTERLWPVHLAFSAFPALIQLLILPFCPESPKYLLLIRQKRDEANAALVRLRNTKDVTQEVNLLLEDMVPVKNSDGTPETSTRRLFWWGMIICVGLHLSEQVSGATAVVYFSTTIFRENAQMENEQAIAASMGIGATFVVASLFSTSAMDRLGRRFLMLVGLTGACICDVAIFVTLHLLAIDRQAYQAAAYASVIFVYLFIFSFAVGPASIPWFYVSELFEPSQRAKANTIAAMSNWLGAFLIGFAFLPMKEVMGEYVFLIYAGAVATFIVFLYFVTPETKGRESKEIKKELEDRMPACCSP